MTASPHPVGPWRTSAGLAALLGLVVPGLGHVYVGRHGKALLFFGVILATYVFGLWLADWRCVHYERYQVWFFAQAFAAGPTAVTAWLTQGLDIAREIPHLDEGQLYVGVAALLNAVAVADAIGCAQEALDSVGERAQELEAAREMERAAATERAAAAAAFAPPPNHPATALADEWPPPPPPPPPAPRSDVPSTDSTSLAPSERAAAPTTGSWLFDSPPAGPVAPPAPPAPPAPAEEPKP